MSRYAVKTNKCDCGSEWMTHADDRVSKLLNRQSKRNELYRLRSRDARKATARPPCTSCSTSEHVCSSYTLLLNLLLWRPEPEKPGPEAMDPALETFYSNNLDKYWILNWERI